MLASAFVKMQTTLTEMPYGEKSIRCTAIRKKENLALKKILVHNVVELLAIIVLSYSLMFERLVFLREGRHHRVDCC